MGHGSQLRREEVPLSPSLTLSRVLHNTIWVLDEHRLAGWRLENDGAREVDSRILANLVSMRHLTLSNDCTQIVCVTPINPKATDGLLLYDVKSQQIVDRRWIWSPSVGGIRFSPCGSKLCFWSLEDDRLPTVNAYSMRVEIKGGRFTSNVTERLPDGWSLLAFLRSRDGFYIGNGSGWVEDSGGRKFFWLPPNWRVRYAKDAVWEGNSLVLVGSHREEPIIIQFQQ